jgi:GDPmannose 4,6-dehydratase
MRKKAIIIGCEGQDGQIACNYLLGKGYSLLGIDKAFASSNQPDNLRKLTVDITKYDQVSKLIKKERPDEIYHLAAFHHSSQDKKIDNITLLKKSIQTNVLSLINFLEAIKNFSPKSRLFYAASSLIFGDAQNEIQDEKTRFNPDTMYGITKSDGVFLCRMYRNQYNVFASTGILYNHESPFRQKQFLSQKVVTTALKIAEKKEKRLVLGDLKAEVDWGYAPDYVEAMHKILQLKNPDDYIIATGKKHSVSDFVKAAFDYLGLDWKKSVKEEKGAITRKRKTLVGNSRKLNKVSGWQPKTNFKQMIKILIDEQRKNLSKK